MAVNKTIIATTKALPIELLSVVDRPAIHHVLEEAVAAGSKSVLVITLHGQCALENHFDGAPVHFMRQAHALGLGHAVGCARHFVGAEPFFVAMADGLVQAEIPALRQLTAAQRRGNESVVAVQKVSWESVGKHTIVEVDGYWRVLRIVDRPDPRVARSNLAVVGRYLLQPDVFTCLSETKPGAEGELRLSDALALMVQKGLPVLACELQGKLYDIGSPLGFVEANVGLALARAELRDAVRELLKDTLG